MVSGRNRISLAIFRKLFFPDNDTSPEELKQWLEAHTANTELYERLDNAGYLSGIRARYEDFDSAEGWQALAVKIRRRRRMKMVLKLSGAAASLILIFVISHFILGSRTKPADHILPGTYRASLILPGGESVALSGNDWKDEAVFIDGQGVSTPYGDYNYYADADTCELPSQVPYWLSVVTPRGGEYAMVFPDGSRVRMNADTRVSFPAVFAGGERRVKLEGEALFEVEQSGGIPFIVETGNLTITVTGTTFNVRSYDTDNECATLINGALSVSDGKHSIEVNPGEQVTSSANGLVKIKVMGEEAVSWTESRFTYRRRSLKDVFADLERWYDVEIVYEEPSVCEIDLTANLPRYESIENLLERISYVTLTEFVIDGRMIRVSLK